MSSARCTESSGTGLQTSRFREEARAVESWDAEAIRRYQVQALRESLMAAVELGVFTAIANGAGTYDAVARAVGIQPTSAERLMVMLCAAGLVEKKDGRHVNAPDVERYLVEGKPGYMGPWITFTKPQWNEWGRLADHLRVQNLKVMGSIETFTVADAYLFNILGWAGFAKGPARCAAGSWQSR